MSLDCFYQLAFAVQPTTAKCSGLKQVPFILFSSWFSELAGCSSDWGWLIWSLLDFCVYLDSAGRQLVLENLGWSPTYVWWLAWDPSQWSQGLWSNKSRSHMASGCQSLELIWCYFCYFPWVKASPKRSLDFKDRKIDAISWWEELKSTELFLTICSIVDICEVTAPYPRERHL